MTRMPRVGSLVEVAFLDHAHGSIGVAAFSCVVWGRLVRADKKSISVRHWETLEGDIRSGNNHEESLILRSAITKVRKI
jgi:hypothetical protein